MNLWFPFCKQDRARAVEWLEWCGELGMHQHTLVLHPAMELGLEHPQMLDLARKAFATVLLEPDREGHVGWPQGPNCAFRQAVWYFYNREPFLFAESDAILLHPKGFDIIEEEYKACGKPFMGDIVPAGNGYAQHMSGVAVYPPNTPELAPKTILAQKVAFDVADPGPIVLNMHKTGLIQHVWMHPENTIPTFRNMESLNLIRDDAVLFHRNKDLSCHRRLREIIRSGICQGVNS